MLMIFGVGRRIYLRCGPVTTTSRKFGRLEAGRKVGRGVGGQHLADRRATGIRTRGGMIQYIAAVRIFPPNTYASGPQPLLPPHRRRRVKVAMIFPSSPKTYLSTRKVIFAEKWRSDTRGILLTSIRSNISYSHRVTPIRSSKSVYGSVAPLDSSAHLLV